MEIILYRHAATRVSVREILSGRDFPEWVHRYNASGIHKAKVGLQKEEVVYTSDWPRCVASGRLLGKNIIQNPLLREAELPLIRFPAIRLRAGLWLVLARMIWLLGIRIRCESPAETRLRASRVADELVSLISGRARIVVVGHGFFNRMIGRELRLRGWTLTQKEGGHGFLSRTRYEMNHGE